jgi:hypothetical protein
MTPKPGAIVLTCVAATVCFAGARLTEDPPPMPKPSPGDVTGVITPAASVARVWAVVRGSGKTFQAGDVDKGTGKFLIKGLPGDETYDVCIQTTDGRGIEGINLDFADGKLLRLADQRRKDLGLPPERKLPFTMDDANEVLKFIASMKDFMELRRVLYLQGHGRRATVLVELMRTREYYAQKGAELIWRVELWYFENQFGGWDRLANQEVLLRRERTQDTEWRKIGLEYYPRLSVYVDPQGRSAPVVFKIPDKPDPSTGRPANTEPELKTQTHISGLDEKADATSQPADKPPA